MEKKEKISSRSEMFFNVFHLFGFSLLWLLAADQEIIVFGQSADEVDSSLWTTTISRGQPSSLYAVHKHRTNRRLTRVPVTKVFTGMNNLPAYHCLARCIEAKDDCAAFNLDKENGVCELLSAHLCNHSGLELEPSDSFTYYDIYSEAATEESGLMYSTPYCELKGFCNPRCEPWVYMPYLDEECSESYECKMRTGSKGVCRIPPNLCKCDKNYYIHEDPADGTKSCVQMEVSGYEVFPNLKSDSKKGLHFKLVMIDLDFEKAANYCVEVEGGHLAYAEDGETNRFLREYMRKNKVRSAYLGLTDQQQEGVWIWIHNGQKLKTAQFWKSGAPDNFNDIEHCAMITNEIDFGWDDIPCDKKGKFFCQRHETN